MLVDDCPGNQALLATNDTSFQFAQGDFSRRAWQRSFRIALQFSLRKSASLPVMSNSGFCEVVCRGFQNRELWPPEQEGNDKTDSVEYLPTG